MAEDQAFQEWIGRTDGPFHDQISPRLCNQFAATFGSSLAVTDNAPVGIHWCLSPPAVGPESIGVDGHPKKGGFLPPISLPRRMWASGAIDFLAPLEKGDTVEKKSNIKDIAFKTGRSGNLCFVTVEHEFTSERGVAIREDQNIVFREEATGPAPSPEPPENRPTFEHETSYSVTSVALFRYSALTFNGHRIHYDTPYAINQEFYPDLVVHGPIQGTLLMNLASSLKSSIPKRFEYRGVAPATGVQMLTIGANMDGESMQLSVVCENGIETMKAKATW